MVTQNELKAFYETELKPKLLFFEEQRQLFVSKLKSLGIIYGILLIFVILTMTIIISNLEEEARRVTIIGVDNEEMIAVAFFAPIIYLITVTIVIVIFFSKMKSSYQQAHFKKSVVGPLVTFIDKNLSYAPEKTIKVEAFHTSQLFKQKYGYMVDKWSGEDYVSGILGGTSVKFSEVHAQEVETGIDDEGNVYTYTINIFKGLFFAFNVNWDFEGITIILPNDIKQSRFKKLLQLLKLAKPVPPELEFVVSSDNPIIANYVSSTAFMQRLLELRRRLKAPIHLSFVKGKLYMAIPMTEDLFEPPVFETLLNFRPLQTTFEYMRLGKVIVEELITLLKQPNSMNF
jgi:hypothetical protein